MTPRERVLAALELEQPDRVPWLEIGVAGPIFGHVIGEEVVVNSGFHPLRPDDYRRYLSQAIRGAQVLGLCGVPLKAFNPAFQAIRTAEGAKVHGRGGQIGDMATFEECIASAPPVSEHLAAQCADIYFGQMAETDLLQWILVGGIFSHAEASMGAAEFAIACHEQPELVERLCGWMGDRTAAIIDEVLQHGELDAILLGDDIAFKTTTFISPDMLRRFVFPQYRKIADRIRAAGVPLMFHSDGNLTQVMDDLIDIGIQCIHPFENLAIDIAWAKETYGDRLCIMGNLDVDFIERMSPAEVKAEATRLLDTLGGPGYIFASGNSITQWAPPQSAVAMAEAVREYHLR
jgi:uroporphyrinogen decarboxylase